MQVTTQELNRTPSGYSPMIDPVIGFVLANFGEEITLDDLATAAGMSRFSFCRRFHKECGMTPMRWLWMFRTVLANEIIALSPTWSLTDVAFSCGFSSSAHFSRSFKGTFGVSPSARRKEAQAAGRAGPRAATPGDAFDRVFVSNSIATQRAMTMTMALRQRPA